MDKINLSSIVHPSESDLPVQKISTKTKVFYPYDRIGQLLQKCFLLVLCLVDVEQVNQELDGPTLEDEINIKTGCLKLRFRD